MDGTMPDARQRTGVDTRDGLGRGWLASGLVLLLAIVGCLRADAATITVSSLNDSGSGSLRAAIAAANPGDTIGFSVTGTITLTSGELDISQDLTIQGPGADQLTISGNQASRVLNIQKGVVTLDGLTIADGRNDSDDGAGIRNAGTLTISHSSLSGNDFPPNGGAIANIAGAILQVTSDSFAGNRAVIFGGAISNAGTATVTGSTFTDNFAEGDAASIGNSGTLLVTTSSFSGGDTEGRGGGIFNTQAGAATVINSHFDGNFGGGGGGGIANDGTALVNGCDFTNNGSAAPYVGGAGLQNTGALDINDSTLSGNSTNGHGGGIGNSGAITARRITLSNNTSHILMVPGGGAIYNVGLLTLSDSTVSGNTSSAGVDFVGGGMVNMQWRRRDNQQ